MSIEITERYSLQKALLHYIYNGYCNSFNLIQNRILSWVTTPFTKKLLEILKIYQTNTNDACYTKSPNIIIIIINENIPWLIN